MGSMVGAAGAASVAGERPRGGRVVRASDGKQIVGTRVDWFYRAWEHTEVTVRASVRN